jgi:hypothetical protein
MQSTVQLIPLADSSVFIFVGSIGPEPTREEAPAARYPVSVEQVIKAPVGLRGSLKGTVTVQMAHPAPPGRYVFFADPVSVGAHIALKERAHLEATLLEEVVAAVIEGYVARLEPRLGAAFIVALGVVGEVRHLTKPAERRGHVPWAYAPLEIERLLKGKKTKHIALVGPNPASKRLPRAPALRAGTRAIFILQHPPQEALDLLREESRQSVVGFAADTFDIQPLERLDLIERTLGHGEEE